MEKTTVFLNYVNKNSSSFLNATALMQDISDTPGTETESDGRKDCRGLCVDKTKQHLSGY